MGIMAAYISKKTTKKWKRIGITVFVAFYLSHRELALGSIHKKWYFKLSDKTKSHHNISVTKLVWINTNQYNWYATVEDIQEVFYILFSVNDWFLLIDFNYLKYHHYSPFITMKKKNLRIQIRGQKKVSNLQIKAHRAKKTVYSWSVFIIHIHHSSTSKLMVSCSKSSSKSSLMCSNINM